MTGELIPTGVTFGTGRKSINDAFSGTANFNNILLDSGGNFSGGTGGGIIYSGGTDLYNIFGSGGSGDITRVQPGTNITTGGTANNPIVNLSSDIILSSISATTISGGTIYSGSTDLYNIFSTLGPETTFDYGTVGVILEWDVDNDSENAKVTLSANTTLEILNASSGDFGTIKITQDGTGGHSLTFGVGTHKVVNGGGGSVSLTSTPGAVDVLTFFYDGTEFLWSPGYNYT